MSQSIRTFLSAVAGVVLAAAASAQPSHSDIVLLQVEDLADRGMVEAEILAADYDERMLTVRFEEDDETARVLVPENAELLLTAPNNLTRNIELSELRVGDEVALEGVQIEGAMHLRIISIS